MDIRGIIFDINGTLIDIKTDEDRDDIYRDISHFLTYQGISLHRHEVRNLYFQLMEKQKKESRETYPEFDAVTIFREIIEGHASGFTRSLPEAKLKQLPLFLAELYRGISRDRLQLYPEVKSVLDELLKKYRLAAISDAQSAYALPEMHAVGLLDYLNPILVSGDYGYRKPDIRLFRRVLEAMEMEAHKVLFVGNDMHRDIFGAQQLGIKTVFFQSHQIEKQIQGVNADYIIYNFSELLQAIKFFEKQ